MISSRVKQALAPIKNMAIGAGVGLGAGVLVDLLMNNKDKEGSDFKAWKRPLLLAALGTVPGLLQGGLQYTGSMGNKGFENLSPKLHNSLKWYEPFTLDQAALLKKSPTYKSHIGTLMHTYKLDTDYDKPEMQPEKSLDKKFNKKAALQYLYNNIDLY